MCDPHHRPETVTSDGFELNVLTTDGAPRTMEPAVA